MWKLEGPIATWHSSRFQARIDVRRPAEGLECLVFQGSSLPHTRVMQMIVAAPGDTSSLQLEECYVRERDLVASYRHRGASAVHPVFYWSLDDEPACDAVRMEALVATETDLLNANPLVQVYCHVPATRCRVFSDPASLPGTQVQWPDEDVWEIPGDGAGHVVTFECEASEIVYGQIAAGTDVLMTSLSRDRSTHIVTAAVSLFGGRLEKGVIRRTRLCGFLTTAAQTERVLSAQWQSLHAAAPPLGA